MEYLHLTFEEKERLMPDVIIALKTIYYFHKYGIFCPAAKEVFKSNDEFFILCYTTIGAGTVPKIARNILSNFINNEKDLFRQVKMSIQANTMLSLQYNLSSYKDYLTVAALLALSHFGLGYKERFIEVIKESDKIIYDELFKNGVFSIM